MFFGGQDSQVKLAWQSGLHGLELSIWKCKVRLEGFCLFRVELLRFTLQIPRWFGIFKNYPTICVGGPELHRVLAR